MRAKYIEVLLKLKASIVNDQKNLKTIENFIEELIHSSNINSLTLF